MIIPCTNCEARLQIDEAKAPQRDFSLRCPKCHHIVRVKAFAPPGASDANAVEAGGDPHAKASAQLEAAVSPHVPYCVPEAETTKTRPGMDARDILQALAALINQGASAGASIGPTGAGRRAAWEKPRALVCVHPARRQTVAEGLMRAQYQTLSVENTAQAIERMYGDNVDVVVLDPAFDQTEQGAAFITREINSLAHAERRRMIVVHLSDKARTEDAHAAFLTNVNLIVNMNDLQELPSALERTRRDLNALYKDFKIALGVNES